MSKPHIHIIGLGIAVPITLSDDALHALSLCSHIIGWHRHKALIAPYLLDKATQFVEVLKISELKEYIASYSATCSIPTEPSSTSACDGNSNKARKHIAVLASGDPLYFGIGRWFSRNYPRQDLTFHPGLSSIQVACHHHGLALQDVQVVSLHGRPRERIRRHLKANHYLVILTDQLSQPHFIADECIAAGFEDSQISVYENLGYPSQKIQHFNVKQLSGTQELSFEDLHVCIVHVAGSGGIYPEFPGIADKCYATGQAQGKGMITKREVRLAIASFMQVEDGDIVWDIGAGCGGVSVELSYWNPRIKVYAIEHHQQRLDYLKKNIRFFGVLDNCFVVAGRAPKALEGLPNPKKVFIGGSDGQLTELLSSAWLRLPIGGVLVVSAVTQTSRDRIIHFARVITTKAQSPGLVSELSGHPKFQPEIEMVELSVTRGQWSDEGFDYESKRPVAVFKFTKASIVSYTNMVSTDSPALEASI